MTRNRLFAVVPALALGVAAPTLTAQVNTPPPPKEERESYTPPPRPVAPAPRTQPGVRASANQQGANVQVPVHKELAQIGDDGLIIRYALPLDIIGMVANPFIGSNKNEVVHGYRVKRWRTMEERVLQNLDLFDVIADGAINEIGLANLPKMQEVAKTIEPLVEPRSLSVVLEEDRVFTPVQTRATDGIVRKYQAAINDELKQQHADEHLDYFMRFIMKESVKDAWLVYENLVRETLNGLEDISGQDFSPATTKALADLKGIKANSTNPVGEAAVRLRPLSVKERQDLFGAVIAARENPDVPDIDVLDLGIGSTTIQKAPYVRVKRPNGGVSLVPADRVEERQAEFAEIERKMRERGETPQTNYSNEG